MSAQLTHEQIERYYDLHTRSRVVGTMANALAYLKTQGLPFPLLANCGELINDGIINALDHRATGREFRTMRHSWAAKTDPQNHPVVSEGDRRCSECGFPNPVPFQHCSQHRTAKEEVK